MSQVSMMMVRALIAALERAGVDRARCLAEAGLEGIDLASDERVSLADHHRLLRAGVALTGDPALGLHMAERASASSFDVFGPLSEQSPSLRDALLIGVRYARVLVEGPHYELHEEGEVATVRLTVSGDDEVAARFKAEYTMGVLLNLTRRFVGHDAQPRRVYFAHDPPAYQAEYRRMFEGREQFGHAFSGLELERVWLDRTQLCSSSELTGMLQARAELLLAKVEQEAPAAVRVRRWFAAQSDSDRPIRPTMEVIARELGMSARSLRRRLRDEHTPFGELLDDALALHAKRMLADPRYSVQEAAYAMGFSTPAAFSRAFKRWTGMAPSAFRGSR